MTVDLIMKEHLTSLRGILGNTAFEGGSVSRALKPVEEGGADNAPY